MTTLPTPRFSTRYAGDERHPWRRWSVLEAKFTRLGRLDVKSLVEELITESLNQVMQRYPFARPLHEKAQAQLLAYWN